MNDYKSSPYILALCIRIYDVIQISITNDSISFPFLIPWFADMVGWLDGGMDATSKLRLLL
jgi:hypothetical protein